MKERRYKAEIISEAKCCEIL